MKEHLKTLDKNNIHAPLLREFLIKNLAKASIITIGESIKDLQNQIKVLHEIQTQIMNKLKELSK